MWSALALKKIRAISHYAECRAAALWPGRSDCVISADQARACPLLNPPLFYNLWCFFAVPPTISADK